jgi:hypothetical protein
MSSIQLEEEFVKKLVEAIFVKECPINILHCYTEHGLRSLIAVGDYNDDNKIIVELLFKPCEDISKISILRAKINNELITNFTEVFRYLALYVMNWYFE